MLNENSGLDLGLKDNGIVGGGGDFIICVHVLIIVLWKIICKLIVSGRC